MTGVVFYALGLWGLLRETIPTTDAVQLLVLAERFSYNRFMPTVAWEHAAVPADMKAPGELERWRAVYGDRRGSQLLGEVRDFFTQHRT